MSEKEIEKYWNDLTLQQRDEIFTDSGDMFCPPYSLIEDIEELNHDYSELDEWYKQIIRKSWDLVQYEKYLEKQQV